MGEQARGRVAELLDELRQTVGAQVGGATRSMFAVYLYPINKYIDRGIDRQISK